MEGPCRRASSTGVVRAHLTESVAAAAAQTDGADLPVFGPGLKCDGFGTGALGTIFDSGRLSR